MEFDIGNAGIYLQHSRGSRYSSSEYDLGRQAADRNANRQHGFSRAAHGREIPHQKGGIVNQSLQPLPGVQKALQKAPSPATAKRSRLSAVRATAASGVR